MTQGHATLVTVVLAAVLVGGLFVLRRRRASAVRSAPLSGVYAERTPYDPTGPRPTPIGREVSTGELKLDDHRDAQLEPVDHAPP